jgi:hypothetical protein
MSLHCLPSCEQKWQAFIERLQAHAFDIAISEMSLGYNFACADVMKALGIEEEVAQ